ncbi:hypothetical protein [Edwardsiella tarda]
MLTFFLIVLIVVAGLALAQWRDDRSKMRCRRRGRKATNDEGLSVKMAMGKHSYKKSLAPV